MKPMRPLLASCGVAAIALGTTGCFLFSPKTVGSPSKTHVAPLTQAQAAADFEEIVSKVKGLYGPLRYKEERFGFKFDDLVAATKKEIAEAKSDEEYFGVYSRFLTKLQDGHVSISYPYSAGKIKRYLIPVFVAPFAGDKAGVVKVDPGLAATGIQVGDELLSVDGISVQEFTKRAAAYNAFGNPVSDRHNVTYIFRRRSFMSDLVPQKPHAEAVFQRPDGNTYTVSLLWAVEDYFQKPGFVERASGQTGRPIGYAAAVADYNDAAQGSLLEFGANTPYFFTETVKKDFDVQEVELSTEMQTKYGLTQAKYQDVYAATYNSDGKRFLLVRQPGYAPEKIEDVERLVNVYRAVLEQMQDKVVGLVIDQNHNPGGYLHYAEKFYRLFIGNRVPGVAVRARTDRRWIVDFNESAKMADPTLQNPEARSYAYYASLVEKANEAGEFLSPMVPITGSEYYLLPDERFTWKKPFIILADELSGSCGDIVPMLMTRNGTGKMFGQRTMGLGGNVEQVAALSESGAQLRLTRSLFNVYRQDGVYAPESWVENNGIEPNQRYEVSLDDLRKDYVPYVAAFTKFLTEQMR
jgi:C-terminal processing protease CtpA/Prc